MSLPEGFKQVEYIQSSGTQYVDTGVKGNSSLVIRAKFNMDEEAKYAIIGYYASETVTLRLFNASGKCYLDFGNASSGRISGGTMSVGVTYNVEFGNRYVKNLDTGANIISGTEVAAFSHTNTVCVFGNSNFSKGKIDYCQIYDNGLLVRDYIPAKTIEGEVGLYDRVFHEFYRNAGTGEFIAGPVAVKAPATPKNFTAAVSMFDVLLAWDESERALGYRLYRDGVLLADQETTEYTDTVSNSDTTYHYALVAYNDEGESAAATLAVYVPYVPDAPPPAVDGLTASVGAGFVNLHWNAAPDADGYRIYRNGVLVGNVTATSYQESGLSNYVEYIYVIAAYNVRGDSPEASIAAMPRLELVTDRTQADVIAGNAKGGYYDTDLNRVGAAILYVADVMRKQGLSPVVSVRADWTDEQWMTPAAVAVYLNDLAELRRQIVVMKSTPQVPKDMERFTFREANDIEMILVDIDRLLSLIQNNLFYAGEVFSGEV